MRYKLIIFDMDGTILNTIQDLADGVNYGLRACSLPERTLEEVTHIVGNGIQRTIELCAPAGTDSAILTEIHKNFTSYYRLHNTDHTHAYEQIPELLLELRNRGYLLAVVSNKADYAVKELCDRYFYGLFDAAYGSLPQYARKPAPDLVWKAIDSLGLQKDDVLYIGDSEVDLKTAHNAQIPCISVSWGFRSAEELKKAGAKIILSQPFDLFSYL